jgi:hypothetical protein
MTVISTGSLSVSSTLLGSLLEEDEGLGLKVPGDRCAKSTVAVSNLLLISRKSFRQNLMMQEEIYNPQNSDCLFNDNGYCGIEIKTDFRRLVME